MRNFFKCKIKETCIYYQNSFNGYLCYDKKELKNKNRICIFEGLKNCIKTN